MTATAIIVLVLSLVVVWGGLALSIVNLSRAPQEPDDEGEPRDDPPGPDAP